MGRIIRHESAVEYFKEMVEAALDHQHVTTGEMTTCYLVNLLADFALRRWSAGADERRPLGVQLLEALEQAGAAKTTQLRDVGDRSLFISGFFADSLKRQLADVDYYAALGVRAYVSLSYAADSTVGPVFAELAHKFVSFVDVLAEVSERSALMSNNDLLRLYEKWLRTGSRRDGRLLVERGIVPNASIGSRFIQ
ncbi:MAG: hypothetical protein ACM3NQ_14370 [Bacteroidales bacterium]